MHKKVIVAIFALLSSVAVFASGKYPNFILQKMPTRLSINIQSVNMPAPESNMGLVGLSYLVDFKPWFYAGIGGYGSVSGKRGGLFALGIDAGLQHRIIGNLWGDAGVYVGGGGGGIAVVGGGLMWRPYANLLYDFHYFRLGVGYSEVHFPTGDINSRQVTGVIELPLNFYYADPDYSSEIISGLENIKFSEPGNIIFEHSYLTALAQIYFQKKGLINIHNKVNDSPVKLVGIEVGHFLTKAIFLYVKSAGAFGGTRNGYMDILAGAGYRFVLPMCSRLSISPAVAVGAGGGGTLSTGGGMLVEPRVGMQYQLTPTISAGVNGGYIFAPFGNFKAFSLTGKLTYSLMFASVAKQVSHLFKPSRLAFHVWHVKVTHQTYFNPQRNNNIKEALQLISVKFDSLLNNYFYLTGQASSAYGGRAGGYASGMIGLGITSKPFLHRRLSVNAEMLAGAAGGGAIAVGGGAIVEPIIGATIHLNKFLGIYLATGRIISLRDKLNATTFDAGLVFTFATLNGL